jgi:hypothetical protein
MLRYKKIKLLLESHREHIISGICCVLMFGLGFGTGKSGGAGQSAKPILQPNYTTKKVDSLAEKKKEDAQPATSKPDPDKPCLIKGNISGTNKIYHVPGGSSYKRVTPEQCFATEQDAEAAGFRKALR